MAERLIHTKIVIDMCTGSVLEDEAYWYDGPVAECKGGGSSSTNSTTNITNVVDEEYNRRLAEIQERAQDLSDKYYSFWEKTSAPLEAAQAQIKLEQTPLEGEVSKGALQLQKAQNEAQLGLLPLQTDVTKGVLNLKKDSLPQVSELTKSFLTKSAEGVNADVWANRAGTDQNIAASQQNKQLMRNASRLGLNPNSGAFTNAMKDSSLQNAAQVAGARTKAFQSAEDENYKRLASGVSAGLGLYAS